MSFLINLIVSGIAVALAAYLTPGVSVNGIVSAIVVAVVLGLVNATVGRILRLLAFPLNFLTFGLIGAIISFFMLLLTDNLIPGFHIDNRLSGIIFSIVLGIISGLFGTKK